MALPRSRAARQTGAPAVPQGLVTAAEWSWRLLVIAAAVIGIFYLLSYFSGVSIPLAVAVLLSALLSPLAERLRRWGWRPVLASAGALLGMALLITAVLVAIGAQVAREMPQLIDQSVIGIEKLLAWLASGPLHIEQAQLDAWTAQFTAWVSESQAELASWVAEAGVGVGHFFAGLAIALISTFFFLASGPRLWQSITGVVPAHYRDATHRAAGKGWVSLVAYMRAQVLVALVDALGMLAGALVLQIPMAWALFAFTFFTAFIPVLGAVMSGTIAVLLGLVTHGWVTALIMLAITVAVVQTEGHFLQPILLGRAVSLHPLAVLVGLAVGATLAGIVGALLVIPVLAFAVAFVRGLRPEPEESASPSPH